MPTRFLTPVVGAGVVVFLSDLSIVDFRNLSQVEISLVDGFNYLYGDNGAGKTATLEAIHLLSRGRSFRTSRSASLLKHDAKELIVRGTVRVNEGQTHTLALARDVSGSVRLRVDGQSESRLSALARHLPTQTLLPDSGRLVMEGPGDRRGFLDWGLFHVEHDFLEVSRRYRRVLAQRNAWLKTNAALGVSTRIDDDPWLQQLGKLGLRLNQMRADYVAQLRPVFEALLAELAPELTCDLRYEWGGLVDAEHSIKKLSESFPRDVKLGVTHRGPHRGDLSLTVEGVAAAEKVSRGQAKLIASAALIAQASLLKQLTDTRCVFLIDDFGAELDRQHWDRFVQTLVRLECQVIANSTMPLDTSQAWVRNLAQYAVFHVEHGRVDTMVVE